VRLAFLIVWEVVDSLPEPDYRYFKLKGEDGNTYLVRNDGLTCFSRFDLVYVRHTDVVHRHRAMTAAECFRKSEENEVFCPRPDGCKENVRGSKAA
jgi:hypothetical protein